MCQRWRDWQRRYYSSANGSDCACGSCSSSNGCCCCCCCCSCIVVVFFCLWQGYWVPEKENVKIPVAIKVLNGDIKPAQNNELLEEARIMASVNHKNCVRILAICMTERIMIITQLMPHGCLREYIRKERTNVGSQVLLNWCMQIAQVGRSTLCPRKAVHQTWSITLLFLNGFSQFFSLAESLKICDETVICDPTMPKTCRCAILWNLDAVN